MVLTDVPHVRQRPEGLRELLDRDSHLASLAGILLVPTACDPEEFLDR